MQFDQTLEWLETNGIGGFASSSVVGINTRRYHALLCAATKAPQERAILVSKIDECLQVAGGQYELGANAWPGAIHPTGYMYLTEFSLDPLPRWVWQVPVSGGTVRLQKTLWMPHGENTTVVQWQLLEGPACTVMSRPYLTGRDYHSTHHFNHTFDTTPHIQPGCVTFRPYSNLPFTVFSHDGEFYDGGAWYYGFEWAIEQERGLDFSEDAYCPGSFVWKLAPGETATLVASTMPADVAQKTLSKVTEIKRREALALGLPDPLLDAVAHPPADGLESVAEEPERIASVQDEPLWEDSLTRLRLAADQFIVRREDGLHTILAGYPWFTDWGRDTMIALPGLCLSTGRFEVASSILRSFAGAMSQGMIPNRFPEGNEVPDYNTVDATLWYFHAVSEYGKHSGDWDTVGELYPRLVESIEWHLAGTRYGIKADDEDGLLAAGDASSQLTWMDAKVGDIAFTPRNGKPVEIQALWFNALRFMSQLARRMDDEAFSGICAEWSRKVAASFPALFWNKEENCLYDFITGDFVTGYHFDGAVRPNQLIAVSLPHRLLSREQELGVVERARQDLLTPHGMRSLSPRDSRYRGIYRGDQWQRDSAYHQGTVWAWTIGPFLSAYLRVHDYDDAARLQVRGWLAPLERHLSRAGLNSISEIFDGDAPHAPRGCFAQAWSVSEVLRVLTDLDRPAPGEE